jgi:lipoprotein signal peptidase
MWGVWCLGAIAVTALTAVIPSSGWFAGLLLGGSFSHQIESARRGWICDYVCLRSWPAFNLADVALVIGAVGAGLRVLGATAGR